MAENLSQPALHIFGDETITYQRDIDPEHRTQRTPCTETIEIRLDDIDSISDPSLKKSLWHRYEVATDPGADYVLSVIANTDDTLKHTISGRKGCTFREITNDASTHHADEVLREVPSDVVRSRFFRRVLGR